MFIKEKDQQTLTELFEQRLEGPVTLALFTKTTGTAAEIDEACPYCAPTEALLRELAALSDDIEFVVYDFDQDKEQVDLYGIARVPAIAIVGAKDYGVRYYGMPSGFEFTAFIEDMMDVSRGKTDLSPESIEKIKAIDAPVHMQVFVTSTCPYCPSALRFAHKLAIASDYITADAIDAQAFPELAQQYNVFGVPRTVVNETFHFEGAVPEQAALLRVLEAAGKLSEDGARDLIES